VDYTSLASGDGIIILKGAELDTDTGHFLVYGISEEITAELDFSDVNMSAQNLVDICDTYGGIAIPAHPGRAGIGFAEYLDSGVTGFETVKSVEQFNGSNRPGEGEKAESLIKAKGYLGTGGSDAHIVSAIGTCMTSFEKEIENESDLVQELRNGRFTAVRLES
jgi:predicted metal-dependent phosphoesterase TrpH